MTFTIHHIRAVSPCYDPARVLPEDWQGTALDILGHDILGHDTIPANDKLWVVLSVPEALSEAERSLILARVVLPLARRHADDEGAAACDAVIALYERRAAGDEPASEEWAAARAAGRAAARAAECAAAGDAECAAEWAAECAAAGDAGWDAAWDAEWDAAAWAAAWAEMAEGTTRLLTATRGEVTQ